MNLSPHFTLAEFTRTSKSADNTPSPVIVDALILTADRLEKVREILGGVPLLINSAYRSPTVNKLVGGSRNSQHCKGEAVDFTCPTFGSPYRVVAMIIASGIPFDQLIYENTWVHISWNHRGGELRNEVLTFKGLVYQKGLVK